MVFTRILDGDLELTARYLCDPRTRRHGANDIWEYVIDTFASEPSVEFAYPTQSIRLDSSAGADSAEPGGTDPES